MPGQPITSQEAAPLLEVSGLTIEFETPRGPLRVVSGISLAVQRSEVVAVVGESGSGKSVTALSMLGLLPRNARVVEGNIHFEGRDLLHLEGEHLRNLRGKRIAMVFQDPMSALNPVLTVGFQIMEPLRIHLGMDTSTARARAVELLGMVGITEPHSRLDQYPHEFSGGMRQRVMIAIALACEPRLLIADEPTTALDVTIQAQILELVKDLTRRLGISLILITHNLGIVARYADRVVVMYAGQVVEQGRAEVVFARPQHMYTQGLLRCVPSLSAPLDRALVEIAGSPPNLHDLAPGCRFAPRCSLRTKACTQAGALRVTAAGSFSACVHADAVAAHPVPAHVAQASLAPAGAAPEPVVIEAVGLSRHFSFKPSPLAHARKISAVEQLNLQVRRGETLGLVGESGCGKSTLARLVLRLDEPNAGQVLFEGRDISHLSQRALQSTRRKMQVVFQDPSASLNPRKTMGAILAEPLRVHRLTHTRAETEARVDELLAMVGLGHAHKDRYSHQLSGGQRQRIGIARALAVNPSFVVCDEAVSALDVSVQAQVVNLLADLQKRYALAYLFIAHDLAVVRHLSNRVAVMYLGRVVELANRDDLYERPLHPYTQLLLEAVPVPDPVEERQRSHRLIQGELPSPFAPPSGCAFRTRCPKAAAECAQAVPALRELRPGQWVACVRA